MELVLSEEHDLLRRTAAEFVRSKSSLKRIRALRDGGDANGFSPDLWHEMAALGWAGIVVPESYGGGGLGYSPPPVGVGGVGRRRLAEPPPLTGLASAAPPPRGGGEAAA